MGRGGSRSLLEGVIPLVNLYQTTRLYNQEDSHLRAHRLENLKSYVLFRCLYEITEGNYWLACTPTEIRAEHLLKVVLATTVITC
jgi:hypothetical protein